MNIEELAIAGERKAFPKNADTYVKSYGDGGPKVDAEINNIIRYGESDKTAEHSDDYALSHGLPFTIITVVTNWSRVQYSYVINAFLNSLRDSNNWEVNLHHAASLSYFGSRLGMQSCAVARHLISRDPRLTYNPIINFREVGSTIGLCLRFGWCDEASTLSELALNVLHSGDVGDWGDVEECPHQSRSFIVALLLSDKNKDTSILNQHFEGDELLVWLYDNRQTDDVESLAHHLKLLCYRHTHQSRSDSMKASYEFSYWHHYFDICEVLAVLRYRLVNKLVVPVVDHRLMKTNLGVLLEADKPALDARFKKTLRKCEKIIADYTR